MVLFFCLFLFVNSVLEALTITPARQEFLLLPTTKHQSYYVVTNDTNEELKITLTTKDWYITNENKSFTCDKWLKIKTKPYFVLKPKESKKIDFEVEVPKDAKGALFAMITVTSTKSEADMLNLALSVPVIIIIKGTEIYSARIDNEKFNIYENNLQLSFDVINEGNIHIRPKGRCRIFNQVNEFFIEIPESRPVYPGSKRKLIGTKSLSEVHDGEYQFEIKLNAEPLVLSVTGQVSISTQLNGERIVK